MTIAEKVKEATEGATAVTYYGGYCIKNGETIRFQQGHLVSEARDGKTGRTIAAEYLYADGSSLFYRYRNERAEVSVKAPKQELL